MSYRDLFEFLQTLTSEQLDMNVTVCRCDVEEFVPITNVRIVSNSDVLDNNTPVLIMLESQ